MIALAQEHGLGVSHGGLKPHLLQLYLSLEGLEVRDALSDRFLARASNVEISLSLLRLIKGEVPVSRIRFRDFRVEAGEWNQELYKKLSSMEGDGDIRLPELLFVDGAVSLGPFGSMGNMDANVREIRIRHGRFMGTRIQADVFGARGWISIPGEGDAQWPFPSLKTEIVRKGNVIRISNLLAWGNAARIKMSGFAEMEKRLVEGKALGSIDLAKWIEAGYPGASYAQDTLRSAEADFSVSLSGPWDNPTGRASLFMKKGDFRGVAVSNVNAALSSSGRMVRLDHVRARLLGGTLEASGSYDPGSPMMQLKIALDRVSLSSVPWLDLGSPVSLSGKANLDASVSGTRDRLKTSVSLSLPNGVESLFARGGKAYKCSAPIMLDAGGEITRAGDARLESVRLRAGRAEAWAEGEIFSSTRKLALRGTVRAPSGKAQDFGFHRQVSWRRLEADWEASGPFSRLRTAVSADVDGLAAWSLPPVSMTATIEGVPADTLRFVVGVPADPFKVNVVGTVSSLMDPAKTRADMLISTHGVNLSESGKWASAVLTSLGENPAAVRGRLEGISGAMELDVRLGVAPGAVDIKGSARSAHIDIRGVSISSVEATGEYGTVNGVARWTAKGEGRFGAGVISIATESSGDGKAQAKARISGLKISQALSVVKRDGFKDIDGIVDAQLDARSGAAGWEIQRFVAESGEILLGDARIADVRAEGALGAETGKFFLRSVSPMVIASADIRRGGDWRTNVSLTASSVSSSFLLAAAGRSGSGASGVWHAEAQGQVLLAELIAGKPVTPEMFPVLRALVRADNPGTDTIDFKEIRAEGARRGSVVAGTLSTSGPETRLAWELSLREPFDFQIEGPFSIGDESNGHSADGKRSVSVNGDARISGALGLVERTRGAVRIGSFSYREGGWELKGKDFAVAMNASGAQLENVTFTAANDPVRVTGRISWDGSMDARVNGKLPAGLVRLVVPDIFERLDGVVTAEVRVTGSASDPVIIGAGRFEDGVLSFRGYAQQFEAIKGEAVLSREKIVFEHFEGRSGGGYFDGWGEVPLQVDAGQRLYFSVDFFDMRYPYPEDMQPVVQGHVEIFGPIHDIMATGEVEVQSARYKKSVYPERAFAEFRQRLVAVSARGEPSDFRVRLDINVVADRTLRIKNNLADASGSGEFKVQGNTDKVIILGSFEVYEGYVELYGNKYEIKRAIIDFQDPRRINPYLDVRAETQKGDYLIAVLVTGVLDKPEVNFSSDPPLGQTDIVSLVSLGVTTQTLFSPGYRSTFGSVGTRTIGGSAIALGSFGGVDERIRGAVGLDKFSIETGFSPTTQTFEPRLVARKSFEDRLSISMSQSLGTTSETAASAELRLKDRVYLEGGWESGAKSAPGQVSGDVKVRYRFQSLKELLNGGE